MLAEAPPRRKPAADTTSSPLHVRCDQVLVLLAPLDDLLGGHLEHSHRVHPLLGPVASRPYSRALWKARAMATLASWRLWWVKRRWYERNGRRLRRLRIDRHAARGRFFVRHPVEGELLEALDEGRLTIGEGTLLEPGCWLTLSPRARIAIGEGCFLNRNTMLAAYESIEIGDHTMFANGCFVGDAEHRFDDPDTPVTWQGFTSKGPVRIGANCWFGVNCVGDQRRR